MFGKFFPRAVDKVFIQFTARRAEQHFRRFHRHQSDHNLRRPVGVVEVRCGGRLDKSIGVLHQPHREHPAQCILRASFQVALSFRKKRFPLLQQLGETGRSRLFHPRHP